MGSVYQSIKIQNTISEITNKIILLLSIAIAAIMLFVYLFSKRLKKPLNRFKEDDNLVEQGDLDINIKADSEDEIGSLMKSFGEMIE